MSDPSPEQIATEILIKWTDTLPRYESFRHSDGVRLQKMIRDALAAALLRLPRVESPEFVEEAKRTRCVDSATDQHGYECVLCGHRLATAVPPRTPGEASPPSLEKK